MRFAGFVERARGLFIGLAVVGSLGAGGAALAQSPEARLWYSQGVQALEEGRPAQAREALARAVAADPGFAGAWLDLALATHADGDAVQAEEFLDILERRFTLPPAMAAGVSALRRSISDNKRPSAGWRWRHQVQVGGGHDSNANAGLALPDLALTFPGGAVVLPLDPAFRPRADTYLLGHLATDGRLPFRAGQVDAGAGLRVRRNITERAFDTAEVQASLGYASNTPAWGGLWTAVLPGPWRLGAAVQVTQLNSATALRNFSLTALHAWSGLPCGPQGSAELDLRQFPAAAALDSRLVWLGGQVNCASPLPGPADRLKLQARLGWESARRPGAGPGSRPGGDTRHREVTLSHDWRWPGAWGVHRVEGLAQWVHARDSDGYSPLLAGGARRDVRRISWGAAYTLPLPGMGAGAVEDRWSATVKFQSFRQQSNLGVFRVAGDLLQLTVERPW